MRYSLPIEPAPPMVTAEEILDDCFSRVLVRATRGVPVDVGDVRIAQHRARTQLSDEVFAAIDRVRAKHPEGLGRQNACKGFEEEMRKFFGMEEV